MSKSLTRYYNALIIDHLASQYVLGTLPERVSKRTGKLLNDNLALRQQIDYWQQQFAELEHTTAAVEPSASTWQNISEQLGFNTPVKQNNQAKKTSILPNQQTLSSFWSRLQRYLLPTFATLSLLMIGILSFMLITKQQANDPLSYVAVLTDQQQQAQVVASTYGASQTLVLTIINPITLTNDEDAELWVISKTDHQARSLGIITKNVTLLQRQLTQAQWRLIKDSDALLITREELGGSAIGEPSTLIVSRGLCVRLTNWQKNG
jgi:anti-sigma-K factor RskA